MLKSNNLAALVFAICLLQSSKSVNAAVTQTVGAGNAVASVDRIAEFESASMAIMNWELSAYTEGLLSVTTDVQASTYEYPAFNGVSYGDKFYGFQPNPGWVTIKTTDNKAMQGVEFLYGNYFDAYGIGRNGNVTVFWETYRDGNLVSLGNNSSLTIGTILAFRDINGFDSLRLKATAPMYGTANGIALDDLRVQLVPVPETSTYLAGLSALGMLSLFGWRNRK